MRLLHAHLRLPCVAALLLVAFSGSATASSTTSARSVAAGLEHTCAVTTAGGVKCWGLNDYGQLGNGTLNAAQTPVDVSGLTSGATAVATSDGPNGGFTCALTSSGGVKCWGADGAGELGDGRTSCVRCTVPVDVTGLTSGIQAIAAAGQHACALTDAGGVKCWGDNRRGQLGDGRTCGSELSHLFCVTPIDVPGLTSGVVAISAGRDHTCAVTSAGGVKCWGSNQFGELGDGTLSDRSVPVDVSGLASGMAGVDAGWMHTCARSSSGGVKCWGSNVYGELGDHQACGTDCLTPVDVSVLTTGVRAVDAADGYTCAVTNAGGLECWGGFGVRGLETGIEGFAGGAYHACAVTRGGGLECWGQNHYGQLGDGTMIDRPDPVKVAGFEPTRCVVPKVVGKTLPKAKARILRAHCKLGKVTRKRSSARTKGHVLAQSPRPGKRLAFGAKVKLTVGKGR